MAKGMGKKLIFRNGNRLEYTKGKESKLVGRVLQVWESDQSRNKASHVENQHEKEGIWRTACNKIKMGQSLKKKKRGYDRCCRSSVKWK